MVDYRATIIVDVSVLVELLQEAEEAYVAAKKMGNKPGTGDMYIAGTGVLHRLAKVVDIEQLRRLTGREKPVGCDL